MMENPLNALRILDNSPIGETKEERQMTQIDTQLTQNHTQLPKNHSQLAQKWSQLTHDYGLKSFKSKKENGEAFSMI